MWSIVTVVGGKLTVLHMTDGCVVYTAQAGLLKKEERPSDKGKDTGPCSADDRPITLAEKETTT